MTFDQHIQLWTAIGTWVAGLATFLAVVVSLHLANQSQKVKLKVAVGKRLLIAGDGSPAVDFLTFSVTNLGRLPVTITSIGWKLGRSKKARYCLQTVGAVQTNQYPIELAHGKSANFMIDRPGRWRADFMKGFVVSKKYLPELVALFHTSVGQDTEIKPEKGLLEFLESWDLEIVKP